MKYENRVVAFIDILGFKSILDKTVDKNNEDVEQHIDDIISAYKIIRDVWDLNEQSENIETPTTKSKKVSIFSDSIVVSFLAKEPSEVFFTLLEIKYLIMGLLNEGILCRGAVSLGKFIHTDEYLFGPALVDAYMLESKAALYPRVILDRSIVDIGEKYTSNHRTNNMERKQIEALLEQDSDGMYYIDYFSKAQYELEDPIYDFPAYIDNLGKIIRKGLMGSGHHSRVSLRIKFSWMRERFNKMVDNVSNKKTTSSLNYNIDPELAEFYQKLKKISPHLKSKI